MRVLRTLLKYAQQQYGLPVNPATGVRALRVPKNVSDDQSKCLTAAELRRFLAAVETEAPLWYPMTMTLAYTGIRFGAAAALKWSDVDFQRSCITVQRAHYRGTVDETKTGVVRVVAMAPDLADVLREHRQEQLKSQAPGLNSGWVFPSINGDLRSPGVLTKPFRTARAAAGIDKPISPHWLRHAYSNLVRQAANAEVQRAIIGHSTAEMSQYYSHIGLEERSKVASKVALMVASSGNELDHETEKD